MHRFRTFVIYWLPVLICMALAFGASGDSHSFNRSSHILEPFLRWLFPHLSRHSLNEFVTLARKGAHVTEYAFLAMLLWRALRKITRKDGTPWAWQPAAQALWIAMIYAATDEFHQTFVPFREGCLRDVLIDTMGAAAGLALLWGLSRTGKWWLRDAVLTGAWMVPTLVVLVILIHLTGLW